MTTNYERIKSMSLEEMAELMSNITDCYLCPAMKICHDDTTYQECPAEFKQWLETETENEKAKSRI